MIVVEDGTGLPNAESYVSTAELIAYGTTWGLKGLTSVTSEQEILLRHATLAIDSIYEFIGERATSSQALDWPRTGTGVPAGVPKAVKDATCEMAYLYNSGTDPIAPLPAGEAGLTELTKEVDSIRVTKKWADGAYVSAAEGWTRKITYILYPYLEIIPGEIPNTVMMSVERG